MNMLSTALAFLVFSLWVVPIIPAFVDLMLFFTLNLKPVIQLALDAAALLLLATGLALGWASRRTFGRNSCLAVLTVLAIRWVWF